ncbi:MAG TPA: hypothetical protein ENN69_04345 [Spirochaetia bacterium]|nr:hypothetical protein [Spirochaetia bacterium]
MRKLTPTEIKDTVNKIRKKYDEYNYKFFKSTVHKKNFESRYLAALKNGVDISTFLLAEIGAVEELLKREEEKLLTKPPRPQPAVKVDFADKIIEEYRKRILGYPDVAFHGDAKEEVRRLYGALNKLEQEYWPELYAVLRNTMYSLNTKTMMNMETQLHNLGGSGKEGIAPRLERYAACLNRFPRDYALIEKEEKDYILEAAFLLHELCEILETVKEKYETVLSDTEKTKLDEILNYVTQMISDFRLKDLKRR